MANQNLTDALAKLQRAYKETSSKKQKESIQKKIDVIKADLKASGEPTSKLAKRLLGSKSKVASMTNAEFKATIRTLSKANGYSFLSSYSVGKVKDDLKRYAKPVGWRFKDKIVRGKRVSITRKPTAQEIVAGRKNGTVYYEDRSRHSDVVRPVKLGKGGAIESGSASILLDLKNGNITAYHGENFNIGKAPKLRVFNHVKEGTWEKIWTLLHNSQL